MATIEIKLHRQLLIATQVCNVINYRRHSAQDQSAEDLIRRSTMFSAHWLIIITTSAAAAITRQAPDNWSCDNWHSVAHSLFVWNASELTFPVKSGGKTTKIQMYTQFQTTVCLVCLPCAAADDRHNNYIILRRTKNHWWIRRVLSRWQIIIVTVVKTYGKNLFLAATISLEVIILNCLWISLPVQ
jgi:hypothetical protein